MERILPLTNGAMREMESLEHLFKLQAKRTMDAIVIEASRIAIANNRLAISPDDIRQAAFGKE